MKTELLKKAKEFSSNSKERRYWKNLVRPLVIIAAFCATYALILPAITMEGKAECGFSEHSHSEDCYEQVVIENIMCDLGEGEVIIHSHAESCYDENGGLVCSEQENTVHSHTESCYSNEVKKALICKAEEHIHIENCYSDDEDQTSYHCGMGVHTHVESCSDGNENITCSIPEHTHEAACVSGETAVSADTETQEDWEAQIAVISFSGNWGRDIVSVARTQLGYSESTENVFLVGNELKGYTRYGEKYGDPYGDWSAMFVSFCAEYAGIKGFDTETDVADWAAKLDVQQALLSKEEFVPQSGDLIFIDADGNGEAELVGIVSGKVSGTDKIEFIAGDTAGNCVEYLIYSNTDSAVMGYGELPENPMMKEEIDSASAVAKMISGIPDAEEAKKKLAEFNRMLDKEAFDNYRDELKQEIAKAREAFDALDDEQKIIAGDVSVLSALETVLNETEWQQLPVLTEDNAVIVSLEALILENETAELQKNAVFGFRVEFTSYTEEKYGEARVRIEFVLPLSEEKAVFDLEAMTWLEDAEIRTETRIVGEEETECQILTGYKRIKATSLDESAVPGSFEESAEVRVADMKHNSRLSILISAAMEYGAWEETCEVHGGTEMLSISSRTVTVLAEADSETQKMEYEAFLAEYEALAAEELSEEELDMRADELWSRVSAKYVEGHLSEDGFNDLSEKISTLIYGDLNSVAEPSIGYNWKVLQESGWFEEFYSASFSSYRYSVNKNSGFAVGNTEQVVSSAAAQNDSDVQIREEGGDKTSPDGAVYVSKTIEGTETENVFDITLEIITQDIVTEVYKEPDMAVVIVMDISNTMTSNFGNSTRYKAAMTAAENFIDQFAENNLGASNIGFVAFNSDAHQIFAMSQCSTEAQATSLKNTMRTMTGSIINASGYADSRKRFTNIEAGLKCGWDLLNTVDNEHKYIIFLSDGFPTTYIESGYVGYDTYDTNGTRFYDSVEKYNGKNRPCTYGTSYSDEAAIRARKMAVSIKESGATIFSVGVDIGGQTIKYYVDAFAGRNFTVVDRRSTNYEIGSASDADAFKNWLGTKIGSGADYYYDSTNTAGLENAFQKIFEQIVEMNAQSSHLDWVATDPMGNMGVHEMDSVEFIGFFSKAGTLVEGNLAGESKDGEQYENTASFDTEKSTISWDLKNSGYVSTSYGSITNYKCTLKYRVRLMNEEEIFEEYMSYDTNNITTLTYRVIDMTGQRVTISEQRSVDFPIPAVEGYLAELQFKKADSGGNAVEGAVFTLTHDTESCGYCRGDGKGFVSLPLYEAVSGADGMVSFADIPSGHTYILTETVVPDGYKANENVFKIKVAYDTLTVTVTDSEGNPVTWEEVIINYTAYKLPETGGSGTFDITFSGILIIAVCVYYVHNVERRYRKEGEN